MPGTLLQDTAFETITIKQLHPGYGAEIIGSDFTNMSEKQLQEIKAAMAKVHHALHCIFSVG
jgi:alpha-ketoglutarate-dependent 2,4-dichlorophenoxyacetate dioxygenase